MVSDAGRRPPIDPLFAGVLAFVGLTLLPALFYLQLGGTAEVRDHGLALAAQGCACALVVGLAVAVLRPPTPLRGPAPLAAQVRLTLLAYLGLSLLWHAGVYLLYPLLLECLGVEFEPQAHLSWFLDSDRDGLFLFAVVTVVLLGPLAEELVFRGYLQGGLARPYPPVVALLVVSVLFGLVHGPLYALPLTLMGLVFGWLALKTGGLLAPMLAHVLHNSITLTLALNFPDLVDLSKR